MKLNGLLWIIGAGFIMALPKPLFAQNVFLELNLNSPVVRTMMRPARPQRNLDVFRVIERAANDRRINGIILNISSYHADRSAMWELRNALEKFKSTEKKIVAFISNADLDMYYLASVADTIVMDDLGSLSMLGYVWGRGYAQQSLEKLGIGVRELRYQEFKSSAETFTRDSLSDADRLQYGEILDDIMTMTRDAVTTSRSWTGQEFDTIINNEFLYSARSALDRGLIDRSGRKDAVIEAIKTITGSDEIPTFVIYGEPDSGITGSKHPYQPRRAGNIFNRPPVIAVIYANGATDMERGLRAWALADTIREVSARRRVKAIVLRISSPGGSAEAANLIAEAVQAARQRIPVVVSMGSVAASGGYWASMTANHIVASPVTLTGSIGVIGSWFYDTGLNNRLGLTVDTIQRGDHADMNAGVILPRRDLSNAEEARIREYILDVYTGFTSRVAAHRNMDIERVEQAAQGRVFSGIGALNAGLIDSIGGLDDAMRVARRLAEIPDDKTVAYSEYPKPRFIDRMLDRMMASEINARIHTAHNEAAFLTAASLVSDLFLPMPLLEDLRFRLANNGRVMPILPLDSSW